MVQKSQLSTSVDEFLKDLSKAKVRKTFLFADLFNSTEYKFNRSDSEWVPTIGEFYRVAVEKFEERGGTVLKFLGDAVMAVFDDAGGAIQAAINLQEALEDKQRSESWSISCKIGVATGEAFEFRTTDNRADYLGVTVDLAARLCEFANGKAILLSSRTYNAANTEEIRSSAGHTLQRTTEQYFGQKRLESLKGIKDAVSYYALFWQASPTEGYLTTQAVTAPPQRERTAPVPVPAMAPATPLAPQRMRGTVARYIPDRGFGFITFNSADGKPEDIWFHKTAVIEDAPITVGAIAFFIPEREPGGKMRASSVVLVKSTLHGQILRYEKNRYGFLAAHDEAGNKVDFFFLPADLAEEVSAGEEVQFIAAENPRGLCAKSIQKLTSNDACLEIGSREQGVVDTLFEEKGYAFIFCKGTRLFAHVSELRDPERSLQEGEVVEFVVAPGRDGGYKAVTIEHVIEEAVTH